MISKVGHFEIEWWVIQKRAIYIAALVVLLITAFWQTNSFTNNLEHIWNLQNFVQIFTTPAYLQVIGRTLGMAAGVTAVDGLIAFPFAYFMARIATRRTTTILYVAILLPLWASYLAKVYAWQLVFTRDGVLNWSLGKIALGKGRGKLVLRATEIPGKQVADVRYIALKTL